LHVEDTVQSVTNDVYLPTTGLNGTTITWSSNQPDVIDEEGNVTRPAYTNGDKTVTLTATIIKDGVEIKKTFTVTVTKLPVSDTESVTFDRNSLSIAYYGGDNEQRVTNHITLPTTGSYGTTISWESSDSSLISSNGSVTRPADGNKTVTLTATIKKGNATETMTFQLTVISTSGSSNPGTGTNPNPTTPPTQPKEEEITVDIETGDVNDGAVVSKTTIKRETDSSGYV